MSFSVTDRYHPRESGIKYVADALTGASMSKRKGEHVPFPLVGDALDDGAVDVEVDDDDDCGATEDDCDCARARGSAVKGRMYERIVLV